MNVNNTMNTMRTLLALGAVSLIAVACSTDDAEVNQQATASIAPPDPVALAAFGVVYQVL